MWFVRRFCCFLGPPVSSSSFSGVTCFVVLQPRERRTGAFLQSACFIPPPPLAPSPVLNTRTTSKSDNRGWRVYRKRNLKPFLPSRSTLLLTYLQKKQEYITYSSGFKHKHAVRLALFLLYWFFWVLAHIHAGTHARNNNSLVGE